MLKGIILVFLGACSFGILSTFVKLAYADGYTLGDVTGTQAFFGAIMLWVFYGVQTQTRNHKKKAIVFQTKWYVLVLAGVFTGLVSLLYYQCVKLVPASIAIILLMQFIWIGVLLELIIFKKKPSKIQLLAVLFVLFGTVLASGMMDAQINNISFSGIVYGLLAAFCYAVFLMLNGKLGNEYPPLKKSALMITGACILIFLVLPPQFLFNGALNGSLMKWGIILAVFGTVIPPICFSNGIPRAGLALSSIISSAELPVAVCMSAMVLQEEVNATQWLGVVIILVSLVLPNLKFLTKK
ncbi:MAG: DMT family transporter [Sphingobacteriaceae bacterium]|nr:DMT family transporter [Sphingobacteriaceae bacterium]